MSRKDEYLDEFAHLEAALDQGQVPAALTPMLRGIKDKLLAEKARYLASFENDSGRTQTPAMGVIESYAEKTETPEPFFGTNLKSRNRIRLVLSQASVDETTGQIHKEGVISEMVMTEKQFGDIIGSQNRGSGLPVTQIVRNGETLEPFESMADPSKDNDAKVLGNVNTDAGLGKPLANIRAALEAAHASTGRLKAADSKALARNLGSAFGNLKSTAGYRVDSVSELYAKKTGEAALTVHLDARSQHKALTQQKDQ